MIIEMVALGLSLIALVFASYIWFKSKRSKQESEASVATLQGQLESLRKQMMELHTGAIGMGQRLQSVEGAMQQVNERRDADQRSAAGVDVDLEGDALHRTGTGD